MVRRREQFDARVREMHRVSALVEHEIQLVLEIAELLLVGRQLPICDVLQLDLLHELLDAALLIELEESLVLGGAELGLEQEERSTILVLRIEGRFGLRHQLVRRVRLQLHEPRHRRIVRLVHPVVIIADRPGDDQRRPRFVDEHGVHFVHDRVGVRTLDALLERDDHVVAQVVESELVVRAVRDVT